VTEPEVKELLGKAGESIAAAEQGWNSFLLKIGSRCWPDKRLGRFFLCSGLTKN